MKITHARNKTQTSTIKLLKCFPISVALSTTSKSSWGCRIPFLRIVSFPLPSSYQDSKISKLWCSQKPRWMCVRSTPLALSNFKCKNIIFEFFAVRSVWYRGEKTEIKGKESYMTPIQGRQPVKSKASCKKSTEVQKMTSQSVTCLELADQTLSWILQLQITNNAL